MYSRHFFFFYNQIKATKKKFLTKFVKNHPNHEIRRGRNVIKNHRNILSLWF